MASAAVVVRSKATASRDGVPSSKSRQLAKVTRMGMAVKPEVAVAEINRLCRSGAQALGKYLLDTFFVGDVANFRDGGAGSPGFAQLRNYHDQLEVSYSHLCMILAVQRQKCELEAQGHGKLLDQLTFSHQSRLVSVKDETKIALLKKAVTKRWPVAELKKQINKLSEPRSVPALTASSVMTSLGHIDRSLKPLHAKALVRAFRSFSGEHKRVVLKGITQQIERLEHLRAQLRSADRSSM